MKYYNQNEIFIVDENVIPETLLHLGFSTKMFYTSFITTICHWKIHDYTLALILENNSLKKLNCTDFKVTVFSPFLHKTSVFLFPHFKTKVLHYSKQEFSVFRIKCEQ